MQPTFSINSMRGGALVASRRVVDGDLSIFLSSDYTDVVLLYSARFLSTNNVVVDIRLILAPVWLCCYLRVMVGRTKTDNYLMITRPLVDETSSTKLVANPIRENEVPRRESKQEKGNKKNPACSFFHCSSSFVIPFSSY